MGITKKVRIIVDRGLEADLPQPPKAFVPGRIYITTDTHKIFHGQGLNLPMVDITGGGGSSGETVSLIAGQNINAYQAVVVRGDGLAYIADANTVADADRFIGVAITSAGIGTLVQIQQDGLLANLGFSFTPGAQVYLGLAGALVQAPGGGAFELPLGVALSASLLELQVGLAIILA